MPADERPEVPRPKVLLTGKSGQVGADLYQLLAHLADVRATDRASLDLTDARSIRECVRSFGPNIIINAAAYTAVDKAESEPQLAAAINATAPGVLAEAAVRAGALLIHYSTDYVFDGEKTGPYVESDPINPLNIYGKTKADGEEAIRATGCKHLIFRTSWVYSPRGSNFMLTILRLARERDELRIVNDQIGAPTSSELIAKATLRVLKAYLKCPSSEFIYGGTYHLTASGHCSWFDFATEIIRHLTEKEVRTRKLTAISSSKYPTPARRPLNSRLTCSKIMDRFGVVLPEWQAAVPFVLSLLNIHNSGPQQCR